MARATATRRRQLDWGSVKAALLPLENGPREIRALDGLRAIAALSIVAFHTLLAMRFYSTAAGRAFNQSWYDLASGVDLFFVLSGFLLFLPYARALLQGRSLPSVKRFYKRRALRILPAYWVCLAILLLLPPPTHAPVRTPLDVLTHILMIHDAFPAFNQDINGPFWTLAVEAQFYLLLPLLALGVAWVVGRSRSLTRLLGALLGLIALALLLRWVDALVMAGLPARIGSAPLGNALTLATLGTQGKHLEVFATGMLCAALYVGTVELPRSRPLVGAVGLRRLGNGLLLGALALIALAAPHWALSGVKFAPGVRWDTPTLLYPLLTGAGFGALLLAILWGGRAIGRIFAWGPLRFVGLISYSLYIWHLPVLHAQIPLFAGMPLTLRVVFAFVVAYLSYQLVERPFLRRRNSLVAGASRETTGETAQTDTQPSREATTLASV